jgi:hypothetical protein
MDSYIGTLLSVLQSLEARLSGLEHGEGGRGSARGDSYEKLVEVVRAYKAYELARGRGRVPYTLAFDDDTDHPLPDGSSGIILSGNPHDDDPSVRVVHRGAYQRQVDIKYSVDKAPLPYRMLIRNVYYREDNPDYRALAPGEKRKAPADTFWDEEVGVENVDMVLEWLDNFYRYDRRNSYNRPAY